MLLLFCIGVFARSSFMKRFHYFYRETDVPKTTKAYKTYNFRPYFTWRKKCKLSKAFSPKCHQMSGPTQKVNILPEYLETKPLGS